jgi:hypothetical protein
MDMIPVSFPATLPRSRGWTTATSSGEKPSLIREDSIRRVPPSAHTALPPDLATGGAKTEKKNQSGNTPWGRQVVNPKKIVPLYWLIMVSSAVRMMAGDADMGFQKCRSIWMTINVVQAVIGESRMKKAKPIHACIAGQ